jgi:hypothetical protein
VRGCNFPARRHARARSSLAARGRFWRVFGGQALFLALSFLMLGAYILEQQFADPVQARPAGLLLAAVLIAVAGTLLYCMLHPARRVRHRIIVRRIPISYRNDRGVAAADRHTLAWHEGREDLLPRNRYLDRTRIRA